MDNGEKKIMLEELYRPPEETRKFIFSVYDKFLKWRALRQQPYTKFNGVTLDTYLDDSRKKFWGYLPISYDLDTPQFFFPETRNQIIAILAKAANMRMKPSFEGVEGFDIVKATILRDLFEKYQRTSNRKIDNLWQFLYTIINGTTVIFTAYDSKVRDVRTVTLHDPNTGITEYKKDTIDESDVSEVIVNLEDFYIPKPWEPKVQPQDECIWRTLIKWSDFKNAFEGYSNADLVFPGQQFSDSSIFSEFLSYDVRGSDFVEVIKYFNKPKDQYAIIANGVLLNPIKVKDENGKTVEEICPLPWNHKTLPFSKTIFEPLDANFFYGMPLAQKVKSPQEALNLLWELLLDREQRSVSAPIITNDPSSELGIEFKAGRVYQVQADPSSYKELQVSPASGSFWNALTTLQGVIQKTGSGGIGPILSGKQPRSATEKSADAQQQKESAGLYFLFHQDLMEQKMFLVLKNMIQFYTASRVEKTIGERKFNKIISLTDIELHSGGRGNHEIRITDKPEDSDALREESFMRSLLKKERVEIIEVTPDELRQIDFDIKIKFEQENAPETERALFLDYVVTMMKLFGQNGIISPKKAFFRTSEKFNENPADLLEDKVISEYEQERFGVKPKTEDVNPNAIPSIANVNNSLRGQMFGAEGAGQRMSNEGVTEGNILQNF